MSEHILQPPVVTPERLLQDLREQRNWLLKESDWTQLPDVPDAIRNAWGPYRQQLRDITDTYSTPYDVVWPTKPTGYVMAYDG